MESRIWAEGIITAFSGYEGDNIWGESLVGHTLGNLGFRFHLPADFSIEFMKGGTRIDPGSCDFKVVLNDLIEGSREGEDFRFGPVNYYSLGCELPPGWDIFVKTGYSNLAVGESPAVISAGLFNLCFSRPGDGRFLAAAVPKHRRIEDMISAVPADWDSIWTARRGFYNSLPGGGSGLARKCWSVLRVNTESGRNAFPCRWTTPDRIPHRGMWLWDSCFHALAWNLLDRSMAQDAAAAVLHTMREDGFIPHAETPRGMNSSSTQPPLLAWTVLQVCESGKDRGFADWAFPRLEKYLGWDAANRCAGENGLAAWVTGNDPLCRCGESGMDNSPRFDRQAPAAAVDFSCFLSNEYESMRRISTILGRKDDAERYARAREEISRKISSAMYDSRNGFFYDILPGGCFERVKTVAGFAPLFAGICDAGQAAELVRHLTDPRQFSLPVPVPSVALSEPSFCSDMWRGPAWLNWTYMVTVGLERLDNHELAGRIARAAAGAVKQWYGKEGVIFEFYDSLNRFSPKECERKGPAPPEYDPCRSTGTIRDFGWSAAITLLLLDRYPL